MVERILQVVVLVGAVVWGQVAKSEPIPHRTECRWVNEPIILKEGSNYRFWYPNQKSVYDTLPPSFGLWPYGPGYWLFVPLGR